jgi:GT2 family glycosyltransferase
LYHSTQTEHPPGILGLPQYDANTEELIDIGSLLDPFLNTIPNLNRTRSEVGMVIGACLWLRRELWSELGGFLEFFQSMGEDIYLCCLARLWGYPVRIIPQSGFWHRVGNSFGGGKVVGTKLSTSKKRRPLSERNKSYVMVLTYPALPFLLIFPLHVMLLLMEGISLSLLKWDRSLWRLIYWESIRSQWRYRRMLYHKRKQIQKRRHISDRKFLTPFVFFHQKLLMLIKHGMPEIR